MHIPGGIVVENGGIGYEIYVPDNSMVYTKSEGDQVMVYTAMLVREDDISLYGFADPDSLKLFRILMTVSGVGAKAALSILSALPPNELRKAIVFEDATALTAANGIGKKTAQRIVLELKDKIDSSQIVSGSITPEGLASVKKEEKAEAVDALVALGYSKGEAVSALAACEEKDLTVEEYIKFALRKLS